ncbi:MAG: OmpA family protein [Spirulina sp. SIO3F2]|nr:OmpA family protein [Spirulina sp. SIO3F2]
MVNQVPEPIEPVDLIEPKQNRTGIFGWVLRLGFLGFGAVLTGGLGLLVAVNQPSPPGPATKPILIRAQEAWQGLPWSAGSRRRSAPTLAEEVAQIQQQIAQLRDRATILESQFGLTPSQDVLEARLARLAQAAADAPAVAQSVLPTSPLPGKKLKVTLPTDLLFGNNRQLSRDGALILDAVIADLSQHEGATIRIAGHVDTESSPEANRELSFQMAQIVEQYLASSLRGRYRWLAIGYGQTRPLIVEPGSPQAQRNRRLEIAVD